MSAKIITGNIFTSKCQAVVNTVNCVGVMGAGIALECRLRYPDMHSRYIELCDQKKIDIGLLWIYKSTDRWILNFPTKRHWKYPSKTEYLHAGLTKFMETYRERGVESAAFPLLGADKGGIPANTSLEIMLSYLDRVSIDIEIYKYDAGAEDDLYDKTKEWLLAQDIDSISELTGLRRDYVSRVIDSMQSEKIVQLNQLAGVKGIGIKTLEKVFGIAQDSLLDANGTEPRQEPLL
jgi:O-acetyl-ADP-ribose deacetylase (regulator of RNase III)